MIACNLNLALRRLKSGPTLTALIALSSGICTPSHVHAAGVQNVRPAAFECTAGARVWIQMDPCPRIYLKDIREDSDDYAVKEEPERGSSVLLERVRVQQMPIDASELCQKLDDHEIPLKHDGSSDVYERSLAKAKYCP